MKVAERFISINGEGPHAGELAVFVRFAGCNLRCSYCDTSWANEPDCPHMELSPKEIAADIRASGVRNVTLTGGEPLLQPQINELLAILKNGEAHGRQSARDSLEGQSARDSLEGQSARDSLEGQSARDSLEGQSARNSLEGQSARDSKAGQSAKVFHGGLRVEVETNGAVELVPFCGDARPVFTMDYKLPSSGSESRMCLSNFSLLEQEDTVKFVAACRADLERARELIQAYSLTERCHVYLSPVFGRIEPRELVEYMEQYTMNHVRLQLQLHKYIWEPERRGV